MPWGAKVAIVTGGSSGIGTALVWELANEGWQVAVADLNENQKLAEEQGDKVSIFRCNVADYDRYALGAQQCPEVL